MQRNLTPIGRYLIRLGLFVVLLALCGGCGKKIEQIPAFAPVNPAAFDAAVPEIKQAWDQALAESANNHFGAAIIVLRSLTFRDLTTEQRAALENANRVYENQLRQNANSGDEAARADLQKLGISPDAPKTK